MQDIEQVEVNNLEVITAILHTYTNGRNEVEIKVDSTIFLIFGKNM